MPTIYDLLSPWSALSCSALIVFRAISADNFHAWMLSEPCGKGFCATVFKQIDWLMGFQIDENSPVGMPPAKRSGKGNGVAAIPSPENRASGFLHTRLKPLV